MATYPRQPNIESFGTNLLTTGDLDPLYIALVNANLGINHLRRWLFAYWCCYHAGASSWLSESPTPDDYWNAMHAMATNERPSPLGDRWPRGHERRHFRGKKAADAIDRIAREFPGGVEELVRTFEQNDGTFVDVRRKVLQLPQFGPWMAFKIADMLERVLEIPISFTDADVLMFKSPYEAALEHYRSMLVGNPYPPEPLPNDQAVRVVTRALTILFGDRFLAPPHRDRPVNIQEVETVLCKWKSHLSGSYPLGLDSREIRHGLNEWAVVSETARRLWESAPRYADTPEHAA